MKPDHGRWPLSMVWVHGPDSMVRLHKIYIFESLGPLTWCKSNVDQEEWPCTKKWMCWFLIHAQKGWFIKQNQVWPFSCLLLSSLGLHLSSLLVKCVEDVACESSHNNFYKTNEQFNLYMLKVIYVWHVPCVVTTLNRFFNVWLYLMLLPACLAQH